MKNEIEPRKEDYKEFEGDYSDDAFWGKLGRAARSAGRVVLERAVTLYVILTDGATPLWAKAVVAGALGYFICPLDAIPDFIPGLGYLDDAAAMALVLTQLDRFLTPEMHDRVRRLMPKA